MIYGYARVSSKGQNLDRQLAELRDFGIEEKNIFCDKESGKDFERVNYLRLKKRLRAGDAVIVKSIDRLGRNYTMILEEWAFLTKTAKCDVVVLDMDLLDTRARAGNGGDLMGRFIADLVLQILSFVAENERANIRERQAEGIRLAKAKGVKFGRPATKLPKGIDDVCRRHRMGEITVEEALARTRMKRSTFYSYYQKFLDQ